MFGEDMDNIFVACFLTHDVGYIRNCYYVYMSRLMYYVKAV